MRAFIEFLLRRRILVLSLTGILAVGGMIAWTRLPIDAVPDVTNVQVMILTEAPGLARWTSSSASPFPWSSRCRGFPACARSAPSR